jgi:hypothetical protein
MLSIGVADADFPHFRCIAALRYSSSRTIRLTVVAADSLVKRDVVSLKNTARHCPALLMPFFLAPSRIAVQLARTFRRRHRRWSPDFHYRSRQKDAQPVLE